MHFTAIPLFLFYITTQVLAEDPPFILNYEPPENNTKVSYELNFARDDTDLINHPRKIITKQDIERAKSRKMDQAESTSGKTHRFTFPKYSKEFTNFYQNMIKNKKELQVGCEQGFTSPTNKVLARSKRAARRMQLEVQRPSIVPTAGSVPEFREPNRFWLMSPIFFVVPAVSPSVAKAIKSRFLTAEQLTDECGSVPCYIYANPNAKRARQRLNNVFKEVNQLPQELLDFQRKPDECAEGDISKCVGRSRQRIRIPEDLDCPENDISKCVGRRRPNAPSRRKPEEVGCANGDISKCVGRRNKIRITEDLPCSEENIAKCIGRRKNDGLTTESSNKQEMKRPADYVDSVPNLDSSSFGTAEFDIVNYDNIIPENCTEDDITKCFDSVENKVCNDDNIENCPGFTTTMNKSEQTFHNKRKNQVTEESRAAVESDAQNPTGGCVWGVITCCTYNTDNQRKACLHSMNCPKAKWNNMEPCSDNFAKFIYENSSLFYDIQ